MVATEARRARIGNAVTYVRVHELERADPETFGTVPDAAREVRLIGAPTTIADAAVWASHAAYAAGDRPLSVYSLARLWAMSEHDPVVVEAFAKTLRLAGAVSIAEVAIDDVPRESLVPVLEALLNGGLQLPVASFRFPPDDPVAAYHDLRQLQAELIAFRAVAPLPRRRPLPSEAPSTGYDDVKLVALARVILDNIDHVQVDWTTHGPKLAQVALLFGASDLDRVSPSDDAPLGHRRAPIEEVQRNITAAFLEPTERDGRFERVAR